MTVGTRLVIAGLMIAATCTVWLGGIAIQWWLGFRDVRQAIAMVVVLAAPVALAPAFARWAIMPLRSDAVLLSGRAGLWFGVTAFVVWAAMSALLILGLDERAVGAMALAALFLGAFASTFAEAPAARPPTARTSVAG
jgi:hypothetical protein